ncbi:MAG: TPM domain-containing protein [Finegoldia sp.]|nr:TPM domain-containing protein [Finegoldia sp.]
MKSKRVFFLSLLIFIFSLVGWDKADASYPVPKLPDDYYLDELNVLDAQTKENISRTNRELEAKTGSQVLVVTLEDIGGEDPFEVGVDIFNTWKIGDKEKQNGVLILLSNDKESDKKHINIITGYGIEGRLNDGKVGRIIDGFMIDDLRAGDYSRGLNEGFKAVVSEIAAEYEVELNGDYSAYEQELSQDETSGGEIIFLIVAIIMFIIIAKAFSGGSGGSGYGGGRRYRRRSYYGGFGGFGGFSGGGFGDFGGSSGSGGGFSGGGGMTGGGGAGRDI